jgi:hypothetical protein
MAQSKKPQKAPVKKAVRSSSKAVPAKKQPPESARLKSNTELRAEKKATTQAARHPIMSAPRLLLNAVRILWQHWLVFSGILLTYAILTATFVGGVGSSDVTSLKAGFTKAAHGHVQALSTGVSLFSVIVGADKNGSSTAAGAYEMVLFVVMSLAIIWALRQVYAKHTIRIRDSFYLGMYPLVPFVIILFIMGLQLIPFVVGGVLYGDIVGGGIAVNVFEKIVCAGTFFLLAAGSIYMLCSTIFALYIATLPDAAPKQALRSARELVRYRHWVILRKLIFLPVAVFVCGAVIIIPISLFLTPIATIVFFLLSIVALAVTHSYLYALYRELL